VVVTGPLLSHFSAYLEIRKLNFLSAPPHLSLVSGNTGSRRAEVLWFCFMIPFPLITLLILKYGLTVSTTKAFSNI
jgi:hypothetical protein